MTHFINRSNEGLFSKNENSLQELDLHPLAELFPQMNETDSGMLAHDMSENGMRNPIVLFQGRILDGRNRYEIAKKNNIPIKTTEFKGTEDKAEAFVISQNLARRHLSESQRATIAARLVAIRTGKKMEEIRAEYPFITSNEMNFGIQKIRAEAAEEMNVSPRTVLNAEQIASKAIPQIQQAVHDGKMTVYAASQIVEKSPEDQKAILAEREELEKRKEISKAFMERVDKGEYNGKALLRAIGKMQSWEADIPTMTAIIHASAAKVSTLEEECMVVPLFNRLKKLFGEAMDACEEGRLQILAAREGEKVDI